MFGNLFAKILRRATPCNKVSTKRAFRRVAIEPLETRRLLAATGSISGFVYLDPSNSGQMSSGDTGFAGMTVELQSVGSGGALSSVAGIGPTQTHSDGSYSFTGLAAGTYQVEIEPSAKLDVGKLSTGSAGGTDAANEMQLTLAANQAATDYNFAILGAQTSYVSLRMDLASTGSLTHYLTTLHTAPTVDTDDAGSAFTTSYTTGGPAVAITSSAAAITSTDSPTLVSMTVTIENRLDGSGEVLAATTTGTSLTSSYSAGVLSVSGVADVATYETVLQSVTYKDTSVPGTAGNRTISVVVNDGTDTSKAATSNITVVQGTGPSGYTISADKSVLNASEASAGGFTLSGATTGDTYDYSITSSGGGTAVTGSGSVTATTQDVTGINVSSLPNGTLTYSVTLTDATGETGAAATATATLDTTAPTGYAITADQVKIGQPTAADTGFTFSGAEVGATYAYSISSSGGGTAVSGSGSVTSATQNVTGVDVAGLSDGTLTFSVTLTDAAGNLGTAVTTTATLDRVAPSGYSIAASPTAITAGDNTDAGFTFSSATVGDTYDFTVTSSGGSGSVSGSGSVTSAAQSVTSINVSPLADGTLTFSVTLSDSFGNVGVAATSTATLKTETPANFSISSDHSTIDVSEAASAGFTLASATVGTTYNYTITSSGGSGSVSGSGTVTSASQDITGIDVSGLPDGTLTFSATLTNSEGTTGNTATATATLDTTVPSGYTISATPATLNVSSAADAGFQFSSAEIGDTYNFTVTSSGGSGSVSGSGTVTSATETISGIGVAALPSGTLTFSVTLTDTAGNVGSAATATAALDTTLPIGYTIAATPTALNAGTDTNAGFQFTGATSGDTFAYTVTSSGGSGSVSGSGTVTSATQTVTGINVSGLPNGTLTFSVTLTDSVGNTGVAATATAAFSTTLPSGYAITASAAFLNASTATAAGFQFSGAAVGDTFNYTVTSSGGSGSVSGSGTVTSATETISGINVASLPAGTLTYSVTLTDASSNVGVAATATTTLILIPPSGYSITVTPTNGGLNFASESSAGFTFADAEVGDTFDYTITSSGGSGSVTGSGTVTSATQQVTGVNVSSLPDGTLTFSVTLTDEAGNVGAAATATTTLDTVVPTGFTVSANDSILDSSDASSAGLTITGGAPGDTYQYSIISNGGSATVTGSGAVTSATQSVTGIDVSSLPDGTLTYSVTLTNPAGNTSAAETATGILDQVAPAGYTIVAVPATVNATTDMSAGFDFTAAEVGFTYDYSVSSSGGGTPVTGSGTVTSATQNVTGIDVSSLDDGVLTFSVTLTDSSSQVGPAATATAMLDRSMPVGYSVTAAESIINAAASTDAGFTISGGGVGDTFDFSVTSSGGAGSVTGSGSVTSATQQVSGIDVSSLSDGTLTFDVTLTNSAGNSGAAATATATLDTAVPTGYTISPDPFLVDSSDATSAGFTFSAATTGATYQYTISSNGGSATASGSGTVTSATESVTGINVSSLADGTLTFSVTLTSADGNTGAAATTTAVLDQTAPAGYTITAQPTVMNASSDTDAGFVFAGAEVGMTFNYSISSSGGGTPITGSGTVTSATQTVTGIDVSPLSDGTLTYSVTLTDSLGHAGQAATATATLERVAPSGYTITANQADINSAASTNTGFTFAGAEVGDTYNYTVTSSGGTGSVTGSGSVTSATQQVTGINVTSLANGTLTFSVTLTDVADNTGTAATATATLLLLDVTSTPSMTATVGQAYTYSVTTNAPDGDTVTVTTGALPVGMTFDDSTNSFMWTPTADQAGTSVSFTATVTDNVLGNTVTIGPVYIAVAAANGLTVIGPPAEVAVGSPVLVAVNDTNAGTPDFTVTTSSTSDPDGTDLTATLMPQTNQVLQIMTSDGEMDFQLFNNYTPDTVQHFVDLVGSGTYTDTSFYRIIQSFVDQGGPDTGSSSTIPVELNADLRFTSSGLLSMANNGVDGNSTEFFITNPDDMSDGFLDFRYTIFGKLISGDNVRQEIAATPVTTNSSGEDSEPLNPPQILSMSITTETSAGVLMLSAKTGAQGPYTVTVSDGLGQTQTFTIQAGTDTTTSTAVTNPYDPPNPWVDPINGTDKILAAANTPVTFTPQGESADGVAAPTVSVQLLLDVPSVSGAEVDTSFLATDTATSYPAQSPNPNLTLTQNGSSYTITPASGYYGVQFLEVTAQSATPASWDSTNGVDPVYRAFVPVFVAPPAPTLSSITADGQPLTGTTFNNNSSTATELSFNVTGAISGATVSVYMDGGTTPIATGTVGSDATTITLTTDGSTTIGDGAHTFTVTQTVATQAITAYVNWTSDNGPATQFGIPASTVTSAASGGLGLTISTTTAPSGYTITADEPTIDAGQAASTGFTFTNATPGTIYDFTVTSSAGGTPVTGSGSVSSPTQDVTGIDVSSLPDGTLTYSVTLTDPFGNMGVAADVTATLDA